MTGPKALPNLKIGDHTRVQVQGRWKPVVVTGQAGYPRSFIVSTGDGRKYRRNRWHLMKATYKPELVDDLEVPNNIPGEQREGDVPDDVHGNTVVVKINLTFFVMPLQLHGRFKRPHASPTVLYADACSLHLINNFFDRRSRTPFAGTLSPFARTFLHAHLEA